MPTLTRAACYRLYHVVETPDAEGNYALEDFELEDRNREFGDEQTQEELRATLDYLLGGGEYCRIDDGGEFDGDDNIQLDVGGGDRVSIPDIRDKIEADPKKSDFYVFLNREYTEYRWVVCERQGTIYWGYEAAAAVKTTEDQTPLPPLPNKEDIYEVDGYASDVDGNLYVDLNGDNILTDDMFRKIEAGDWNA